MHWGERRKPLSNGFTHIHEARCCRGSRRSAHKSKAHELGAHWWGSRIPARYVEAHDIRRTITRLTMDGALIFWLTKIGALLLRLTRSRGRRWRRRLWASRIILNHLLDGQARGKRRRGRAERGRESRMGGRAGILSQLEDKAEGMLINTSIFSNYLGSRYESSLTFILYSFITPGSFKTYNVT